MAKGWTKMDEGSWRHDASGFGQNKLNIYGSKEGEKAGTHIADAPKGTRFHSYTVKYTFNDGSGNGTRVVAVTGTKEKAKKEATQFIKKFKDKTPGKTALRD